MFNKNDTVCFLGDSITTHGHFIKEVLSFWRKITKKTELKCSIAVFLGMQLAELLKDFTRTALF